MKTRKLTPRPRPGNRPGELEFRFKRSGYTLAVDLALPNGSPYLTISIWMHNAQPSQPAYAHGSIADCRLSGGGMLDLGLSFGAVKSDPTLWVSRAGFSLRPAEYEALREHLLIHGLVHHVDAESPTLRPQARAPLSREYEGEVEGCGGDAELNRHL